jgi:cytochrome c-type biogenesis protein CcmE
VRPKIYKFLCIAALFFIGIALILYGTSNSITFFLTTSQIIESKPENTVRLGGFVKKDSIKYLDLNKVIFIVTDNMCDIKVQYSGTIPMLFRESQGVILKGKMQGSVFVADQMLAKHDESYAPQTGGN